MANVNNTSSYMDADKKEIIKKSNYTYRDALEVSAYLIEKGKFERPKALSFDGKGNKYFVINILLLSIIFTIVSCIYAFYMQIIIDHILTTSYSNLKLITLIICSNLKK